MSLTYRGDRAIVGIPARDLTDDEIAALAKRRGKKADELRKELLASDLYTEQGKKAADV